MSHRQEAEVTTYYRKWKQTGQLIEEYDTKTTFYNPQEYLIIMWLRETGSTRYKMGNAKIEKKIKCNLLPQKSLCHYLHQRWCSCNLRLVELFGNLLTYVGRKLLPLDILQIMNLTTCSMVLDIYLLNKDKLHQ